MSASTQSGTRFGVTVAVVAIAAMSAAINLLSLGGAIYMLQVYDRVMSSQSIPTLVVLSGLLVTAYIGLGLLEALRTQIILRIGARIDAKLVARAFDAVLTPKSPGGHAPATNQPLRDLESLRALYQGSAPTALLDLPWVPLFLIFVAVLDVTLGWVTFAALLLVFAVGRIAQRAARKFETEASDAIRYRRMLAEAAGNCADIVQTMGLAPALSERRFNIELVTRRSVQRAGDRVAWLNSLAKLLRLTVHSALIGIGVYVALRGDLSLGAIVAATIAAGRALAPVELATAHWHSIANARAAWQRLRALPVPAPAAMATTATTDGGLSIQGLTCLLPGRSQAVLRGISIDLQPGDAVAVLGKSAAGKTVLAEALVGIRTPTVGSVRLGDTPISQLSQIERRMSIGYAPQREQWLPGDIVDTITGFGSRELNDGAIDSAQAAGIHRAISELPNGYATPIEEALALLSQGQRRQLALSRAFHGTPRLIVLDDPFADLDLGGERVLNRMIAAARKRGAIIIVTSNRRLPRSTVERGVIIEAGSLRPLVMTATVNHRTPDSESAEEQSASVVPLPRRIS